MPRTFRYCRPKVTAEESLLSYLQTRFSYLTPSQWAAHLEAGHLHINDEVTTGAGYVLKQGDLVTFSPPRSMEPPIDDEHIKVLHEDEDLVVCVKNGCIPVTEGGRYCENTLVAVLHRNGTQRYQHSIGAKAELRESSSWKRVRSEQKDDSSKGRLQNPRYPSKPKPQQKVSPQYRYFPVHRLDKETSGVIMLAKSAEVAKAVSQQFETQSNGTTKAVEACKLPITSTIFDQIVAENKLVTKTYIAVLAGVVPAETSEFLVTTSMGPYSGHPIYATSPSHQKLSKLKMLCEALVPPEGPQLGKVACSRVTVLTRDEGLSVTVARIDILTGRTHQIRLHCAHLGFPVLGDKLYSTRQPGVVGYSYAVDDAVYLARVRDEIENGHADSIVPMWRCRRHLLHAWRLAFVHPTAKEFVEYSAAPEEWLMMSVDSTVANIKRLRELLTFE